jgi:hypothetical protein
MEPTTETRYRRSLKPTVEIPRQVIASVTDLVLAARAAQLPTRR